MVFSTMGRACDAASDVLCRDPPRIRPLPRGSDRIPIASDRRTLRRRCLVKGHGLAGPGRLSSPSAPSPCRTSRCLRSVRGIPRSPPPVSLLACSWLSPPRPGFRRPFAPGAPANGSQGARPLTFRSGPSAARRLLQPPQPASTPTRSSDPRLAQPERALARSARRPRFREARRPHRHT